MKRLPDIYFVFFKCSRRTEPKHSQRCWLAAYVGRDLSECASLHFFCGGIFYPLVYYGFSTGLHSSGLFVTGMLVFDAAFQQGSAPGSSFIVTRVSSLHVLFIATRERGCSCVCHQPPQVANIFFIYYHEFFITCDLLLLHLLLYNCHLRVPSLFCCVHTGF